MPTAPRPGAIIFRKRLLPWSETFIAEQGGALRRYQPVFAGYARDASGVALLGAHPVLVVREHAPIGVLGEWSFKKLGHVPRRWREALRGHAPRIVHAHFGSAAVPASALARALGVPLVVTYHGVDITVAPSSERQRRARRAGFAAADAVIAVSQFIAQALRHNGCPEQKIHVHSIGIDTEHFAPGTAPRDPATVLFVGRLVEKKGAIHLVRAMAAVRAAVPGARLVVVGEGSERPRLEAEAAARGVPVEFRGVQPPAAVRAWMQRATVLCGPSIVERSGNTEGLGMVFVEAQACGCPVVVSDAGGARESLLPGESGTLVPPADPEALAAALIPLLQDPGLAARMGAAARAQVLDRFDLRRQTDLLESLYDEIIARDAR